MHVQDADDPDARLLADFLASFDLVQHVSGSTHRCGNTLDLVITPGAVSALTVSLSILQVCCQTIHLSSVASQLL